jgi:hypothetical protein
MGVPGHFISAGTGTEIFQGTFLKISEGKDF